MIGHEAISEQPRLSSFNRLGESFVERIVVPFVIEKLHPRVAPIQYMVNETAFGNSMWSSHNGKE